MNVHAKNLSVSEIKLLIEAYKADNATELLSELCGQLYQKLDLQSRMLDEWVNGYSQRDYASDNKRSSMIDMYRADITNVQTLIDSLQPAITELL